MQLFLSVVDKSHLVNPEITDGIQFISVPLENQFKGNLFTEKCFKNTSYFTVNQRKDNIVKDTSTKVPLLSRSYRRCSRHAFECAERKRALRSAPSPGANRFPSCALTLLPISCPRTRALSVDARAFSSSRAPPANRGPCQSCGRGGHPPPAGMAGGLLSSAARSKHQSGYPSKKIDLEVMTLSLGTCI
jgi:hypothetical protein